MSRRAAVARKVSINHPFGELLFPSNFTWAASTAAFQIEGATREGGRGPSIWDRFVKERGAVVDNSSADVACDSYHKFRNDVAILKYVGQYRFSISWSRILPTGTVEEMNQEGVQYYHHLIDALLEHGIIPMVTLYHWDLPLSLQDRGGWLNEKVIDWFGNYASLCFQLYGEKVKHWITLNEPYSQIQNGYCADDGTVHAPAMKGQCEWTAYLVGYHMLLAHSRASKIYRDAFKDIQNGRIGVSLSANWMVPETEDDEELADRAFQMMFGWFAEPIFGPEGDYPAAMTERMDDLMRKEGRVTSRLPILSEHQVDELLGSADFLGINYYNSLMVREPKKGELKKARSQLKRDVGGIFFYDSEWPNVGKPDSWIKYFPEGLREILKYVKERFDNVPVMITENGCMDTPGEEFEDDTRIFYMTGHLAEISRAINEDGCNVLGYSVWSIMDNFEWADGYTSPFGLYHVNFEDPERERTPKKSAEWFRRVTKQNAIHA
ncbi:hypothetical protein QR680_004850 [Steinernema hermaphroditum]|uniref:Beta-glucosidase n=1 Tax=Steinernema hermaphroditum TaxID=289476 RepID=A0AA39LUC7_9BILA|nr:hypothetical protein QR680_004850 [Steinernema hermaphroditum]